MAITRRWAGHIYGTNTGNIYLEFDDPVVDTQLTGTLRVMDPQFGLGAYKVKGTYADVLALTGTPTVTRDGTVAGDIEAQARLTDEGNLRGDWKSTTGTAGTFVLYPHDLPAQEQPGAANEKLPEQLFTSKQQLGALRLYADGIKELARDVQRDFTTGRIIVTYIVRGTEVTKYLEDFLLDAPNLGQLRRFKLHIQEPDAHAINKVVTIDLNAFGNNDVLVQGVNELWVAGKTETIARTLRSFESALVTNYKKFGLTLNQLLFLAMLILIPAIDQIWYRAAFVVGVILLLQFLFWLHTKFIPVLIVYPSNPSPSLFQRLSPSLVSWLIAASSALAASYLFMLLTTK